MKRKLFVISTIVVMLILCLCCVCAFAEDVHHTLIFHSGENGTFANGDMENVLSYAEPVVSSLVNYEYSHTPNLDDAGVKLSNYGNSLNLVDVVTIPGAMSLHVKIIYGGESSSYDWVCMWEGAHPDYTASANYGSSITGRLGGGSHTSSSNTKEYDVDGSSVTFGFRSDGGGYGDGTSIAD